MTLLTTAFAQGTHAARPAAAASNKGFYYAETDTGSLFQSTGAAWTLLASTGGGGVGVVMDYVEITATVNVTSTNEAAPDTIIAGNNVAYTGGAVLFECFIPDINATNAVILTPLLLQDGVSLGRLASMPIAVAVGTGVFFGPWYFARKITPAAGNHTLTLAGFNGAAGTIVVEAGAGGAGVLVPAFIRVTTT